MKKFFFLAIALVAAVSMSAQTAAASYYFNNNAATYTLSGSEEGNGFTATTYTMDGVEGFSVSYATGNKGYVYLAANGDIFFEYSNSSDKNNVVKTGNAMFVCDSKNFVLNVKNLKENDEVYLLYSAKGSTAATLTNADNENTTVMADAVATSADKCDNKGEVDGEYKLAVMHVKAVKNGGIKIKETAGGMRVFAIGINQVPVFPAAETAVENVMISAPAQKVIENGMLIIIKDGVRYNALGAKL